MPKIKANNINLYYEEYGEGEPVIFVSGFSADHSLWSLIVREYAKQYRTIIFDNRGAGQSDSPDYPYTISMMADDVVELSRALNIETAHFIGSSMGGAIVQTLAYKNPELVKSAVISNSMICPDIKFVLFVQAQLELMKLNAPARFLIQMGLSQLYSSKFLSQEDVVDEIIAARLANPFPTTIKGFENQLEAVLAFDSSTWLSKITRPCLVTGSDEDIIVFDKEARKIAAAIPGAKYHCFTGGVGHLPHIEQPAAFNKAVLEFIAGNKIPA